MLSLNDIVTAAIALAAVAVPAVAIYLGVATSRRAARSSLTELTLRIGEKAAGYNNASDTWAVYLDIWVLARQADDIRKQLRNKFPESVGVKIAQALELGNDWAYADRYWELASQTADPMFRAKTRSFWALAVFWRGEKDRGRKMTEDAVEGLTLSSVDADVFRGDTYRFMGEKDPRYALSWFTKASAEFDKIPVTDGRRQWVFGWLLTSVQTVLAAKRDEAEAPEASEPAREAAAAAIPPLEEFERTVQAVLDDAVATAPLLTLS